MTNLNNVIGPAADQLTPGLLAQFESEFAVVNQLVDDYNQAAAAAQFVQRSAGAAQEQSDPAQGAPRQPS